MSAGITFPASSTTTSPGTIFEAGRSIIFPSRKIRAWFAAIFFNASIAFSARYSWMNPTAALIIMIARIIMVSVRSPIMPEIIAAAIRMRIMKSDN